MTNEINFLVPFISSLVIFSSLQGSFTPSKIKSLYLVNINNGMSGILSVVGCQ